jgi:hypothetical protein
MSIAGAMAEGQMAAQHASACCIRMLFAASLHYRMQVTGGGRGSARATASYLSCLLGLAKSTSGAV